MFCSNLLDEKFFQEEVDDGKVDKITWRSALLYAFIDSVFFGIKFAFFLSFSWLFVSFFVRFYLVDAIIPVCPLLVN